MSVTSSIPKQHRLICSIIQSSLEETEFKFFEFKKKDSFIHEQRKRDIPELKHHALQNRICCLKIWVQVNIICITCAPREMGYNFHILSNFYKLLYLIKNYSFYFSHEVLQISSVVLVSGVHPSVAVICIYLYRLFSFTGYYKILSGVPCNMQQLYRSPRW